MAKNLVIVESPAKAKTISQFLGKDYKVLASMGHVRDLPKSEMGVDIKKSFKPSYQVSEDKKKVIGELKKALKAAKKLWIATDEDREGEAIGWHLLEALEVDQKKMPVERIVFHEITKTAIQHALETPRKIDMHRVDAQQARRVLDRLVGYELSPLLWKKVRYGLSAGRVQSVAVRLVVEREREILAFKPEEYWSIVGNFQKKDKKLSVEERSFSADLTKHKGKKLKVTNEKQAKKVLKDLDGADYVVEKIEKKQVKRSPAPPFITSTLQQEASRKLGFSVKKTMMVAQQLYEGVDTKSGRKAMITYMRTDSVNLSNLALKAAKKVILEDYGKEYALPAPRKYKGRKGAQEAHEAIRPVDIGVRPDAAAKFLKPDQLKLYTLVWQRTVACQMEQAVLDKVGADIVAVKKEKNVGYTFRATGQTVKFPGFMEVYMEGHDEDSEKKQIGEKFLPDLEEGEHVDMKKMIDTQHFTKPPARYTEASLVKKLESEGIGRPSTYAPTITTIVNRGYIEKEARTLRPTDLAMLVTDVLVKHFSNIVDYKFTADMEDKLDAVEHGKQKWVPMIKEFYGPFHELIEDKNENLDKGDILKKRVLGTDKKSGLDVVVLHGRNGPFVQLGDWTKEQVAEMEEKPRRASLPEGAYFETIDMKMAMKALELPRNLGKTKKGDRVIVTTGRFGPYMKVGDFNVSLPKEFDPYTVKLKDVEKIIVDSIAEKKKMMKPIAELGTDPNSGGEIVVKNGRFGPYVTDGKTNVSVPKKEDPAKITFDQAVEMLVEKRKAPKRRFYKKK